MNDDVNEQFRLETTSFCYLVETQVSLQCKMKGQNMILTTFGIGRKWCKFHFWPNQSFKLDEKLVSDNVEVAVMTEKEGGGFPMSTPV